MKCQLSKQRSNLEKLIKISEHCVYSGIDDYWERSLQTSLAKCNSVLGTKTLDPNILTFPGFSVF